MVSEYLKSRMSISRRLVKDLLTHFEYVSIYGKHVTGKTYRVSNFTSSINDSGENTCGFVVKIFHQGIYSEYSFGDIQDSNYDEIKETIITKLNLNENLLKKKMKLSALIDEPLKQDFERLDKGKEYNDSEIMNLLKRLSDESMKEDKRIIQAMSVYLAYTTNAFFISKNRELTQSYQYSNIYSFLTSKDDDNMKQKFGVYGNCVAEKTFAEAFDDIKNNTSVVVELLKAKAMIPGEYDIITTPGVTGLIVHEAFGHGVEMDMFVKKRAKSRLYLNKPVASPLVTMHDGASAATSNASFFFDDDGVLAHDTIIIDHGILKGGISDVISANELGLNPTGNSRRESPYRKAYSRMTNTYFEPGESNLEDMIKSIDYGFMLCESDNGMEDPKNWNIQCTAQYAKEIKNGRFTGNIFSPVVMSGYVPDLLMSISMVSKNMEIHGSGHCGKGHKEWVVVSDGGPCLKARCKLS